VTRGRRARAAVWALLLEGTHPGLATDVIYVAGDRVVTDPLCKPFSMGRNMFCVHSKKRMDDVPALKEEKQRTNRRTLSAMLKALKEARAAAAALAPRLPWGSGKFSDATTYTCGQPRRAMCTLCWSRRAAASAGAPSDARWFPVAVARASDPG